MPNEKMARFFARMEEQGLMLTYDDVRLRTHHSDVLPTDTSLVTRFSRRVELAVPIVSSPMDTVTTGKMAIAMAEAGGLGIIHRGLTPEAQAKEVARVKHRLHGRIQTPIVVHDTDRVADVLRLCREKGYEFRTFPVLDESGKVAGLITGNDLDFCEDESVQVVSVMTPYKDLMCGDPALSPEAAYDLMLEKKKKVLLLVGPERRLEGMYIYSDLRRIFSARRSQHTADSRGQLRVGAAVGVGQGALARAALLVKHHCDVFQIDTAHGDSANVLSTIQELKRLYPAVDVVAGNVSSGDAARRLADAGADGVLVGQGPGSICTTRVVAGIGVPQVSAVYECVEALRGTGVPVCADGGVNSSGDMVIALALGASCVMLGRLLAGTAEAPGETRFYHGMQVKDYRGMGSLGAMRDNFSSRERYGQLAARKVTPEGVEGIVPYRGPLADVLGQYIGGIRSGLGYHGARTLRELCERADIFRITGAGLSESHPHDITITAEAPNYGGRG